MVTKDVCCKGEESELENRRSVSGGTARDSGSGLQNRPLSSSPVTGMDWDRPRTRCNNLDHAENDQY